MHTLSIDIETYSSVDLLKSGVYKYTEAPDFTVLLFGYSVDGGQVEVVDLTQAVEDGGYIPECVWLALTDPAVLKTAFNASFERTCLAKYLGVPMPAEQWECTLVKGAMLGLPLSLDAVAKVLHLEDKKDAAGKALMKYFSVPCKPSKTNGNRSRNLPTDAPDKWAAYIEYCRQDVVVEMKIRDAIGWFTIPAQERQLWVLDQQINDRGVLLDRRLINNALGIDAVSRERLTAEAVALTGLNNPNSAAQLKDWLSVELSNDSIDDLGIVEKPVTVTTLRKNDLPELLASTENANTKRVLEIRAEMSKTSIKKYASMLKYICTDDRVRGIFQFYGANRTGRWAGRGIQPHNLPRISYGKKSKALDLSRTQLLNNEGDEMELFFNTSDALSQLLRTAFVAAPGKRFIVADFSAIEARVIAWLAGEQWRLDVFSTHGKIYEASAAAMFRIPIEQVTDEQRQRGKVAELALGFQGGKNALLAMDTKKVLKENELQPIVDAWRKGSPNIVKMWYEVQDAAIGAVETGQVHGVGHGISYYTKNNVLFAQLPSGRALAYQRPRLKPGKFGGSALVYEGWIQEAHRWGSIDTYGGSLVENLVQAIARDCLAHAMLSLRQEGYAIAIHVHDEVVCEVPDGVSSLAEVCGIMGEPAPWAKGLPLGADGFEGIYYKK